MTTTQPLPAGSDAPVAPRHRVTATVTVDRADPTSLPAMSLGYVAGFDGLRAFGLLTILAYHHGYSFARGGIFTVSMFFTLSGFLIASLALVERSRTGGFSMASFWERRARRLLPAAMLTIVAIVALQRFAGVGSSGRFRGDLLGALGYVANWRLAFSGGDYADAFVLEAPVQHFWSLAVEEQFYLAFPLVFVGLLAAFRGRWRWVGAVLGATAAVSFVAAWLTASREGNSGLAYYATYTRAGEILVGVALAFAVQTRPARRVLASAPGVLAARMAGVAGVAGLAVLWHTVGLADRFVFHGGTLLDALLTSLVVVACIQPNPGTAARLLGVWPLRNLGKISYGVYLFHWPLFLWLDHERTGLGDRPLFALRVALTILLAAGSYHLIEARFRTGGSRWSPGRLAAALAVPALTVVALVLLVPVREAAMIDLSAIDSDAGPLFPDEVEPVRPIQPAEPAEVAAPEPGPAAPTRVLLVGDSVSWTMLGGLATWNESQERQIQVDSYRAIACTLAEPGPVRSLEALEEPLPPCVSFREGLVATLAAKDYDAIVVAMGHKDLSDRQIDGGTWRHFGDPVFDDWWHAQAAALADILAAERVPVLWATAPVAHIARPEDPSRGPETYPDNDPARVARLNELLGEVVRERRGMQLVDVAGWLADMPGGETDPGMRADGVHWTVAASDALGAWLVPQVLEAVDEAPDR